MKKGLLLLLVIIVAVALVACGGGKTNEQSAPETAAPAAPSSSAAAPVEIKISMTAGAGSGCYNRVEEFTKAVNADCGDAFNFKLYPNDQLGGYDVVTEELIRGTVEMVVGGVSANLEERITLAFAPYLAYSLEDSRTVFAEGSFIYETMKSLCADMGLVFLGFDIDGMAGLSLADWCPDNPYQADSGEKHQLRAPPSNQNRDLLSALGYIPASIDWTEVYSAVQTGVVDGFLGATPYVAYTQFGDVIKYFVPINNFVNSNFIVVNQGVWDSLTPEQQASFAKHSAEIFNASIDTSIGEHNEYIAKLEEGGVTVVHPQPGDLENLAKLAREAVWPGMQNSMGQDLYDKLLDYYDMK